MSETDRGERSWTPGRGVHGPASWHVVLALTLLAPAVGCGGSGSSSSTGSGIGAGASGGAPSGSGGAGVTAGTGGSAPAGGGGVNGSGGVTATHGSGGAGSGGGPGSGGRQGSGGRGAVAGSGGAGSGGVPGSGGAAPGGHGGAATGTGGAGSGGRGTGGAGSGGVGAGGAGGAGGAPSTAALLVDLASAFCGAARTCCAMAQMPTTLDDCETRFQARLPGLTAVHQGVETIDDAALAACVAGYQQAATTCAFQPLVAACKGVFVGTLDEGAACGKGGVPSTSGAGWCKATGRATACVWTGDSNVATTTGTCHTPAHGKLGDPCATSCAKNDSCVFDLFTSPGYPTAVCFEEDGLYCASGATSSVCAAIVPTGGSCADNPFSCASTDTCGGTGATPACQTAATLGQACSSSGPECAQGMSLGCGTDQTCHDLGFAYDTTCGGTPPFP